MMPDRKRLFIGVKVVLLTKTVEFCNSIQHILQDAEIKWVSLNNLHLTLKFLGDVESENVSQIISKMNFVAGKHKEFKALLKGAGIFKDFYHPKVLWLGLRDCSEFEPLKNDVENEIGDLGFEIDYRKFTPHLTIGRFKNPGSMHELKHFVSTNQETYFQSVPVKDLTLFESILKPEGPKYKIIESIPLGQEEEFQEYKF